MIRGTTPTHIFEVPIDVSLIKEVKITYCQNDSEVLVKRTEDCTIEEGTITVKLSQEDTFKFEGNAYVAIQLRVLTTGGDALASDIFQKSCSKVLDDEVLR